MTSRARALLFCVASLLLIPAPRFARAEVDFTSKTYVNFFRDARDERYAPLYEYIELESKDPERGKWSMYLSGWAVHDFETTEFGYRNRNELTYAFLRHSPFDDRSLQLEFGRHYVFEGAIAEHIDGLSARWEFTPLNGAALFGGVPVDTDFDNRHGDTAYGGRVYQRIAYRAELGLSFFSEANDGARFREETGLWLLPVRGVEVKGHSFYNDITDGWAEHAYTIRVFPSKKLTVAGQFSRTGYDDAFSARTLSVFSPDFLGPHETLTKEGGSIEWRLGNHYSAVADYTDYAYRVMGDAGSYGGTLKAAAAGFSAGLSLHRMRGDAEKLRYLETRVYAAREWERWRLSFDALNHHYDAPVSGVDNAYSVNGTIRRAVTDELAATLSVDYGRTPDFSYNSTVLVGLIYTYKGGR
jgi:hypothetical protein